MEEITHLDIIDRNPIQLKNEDKADKAFKCQMTLTFMDNRYSKGQTTEEYYKYLKAYIPLFKKNIYNQLTPQDRTLIKLLDENTMKLINESIKINIEDMKWIIKNIKD
jgi:hypothetical protein